MASRTGTTWRLSAALWAERRSPALARRLQAAPVRPGTAGPLGEVYRSGDGGPLLVLAGGAGPEPHWLGSALASALDAVSVVVPGTSPDHGAAGEPDASAALLRDVIRSAPALGADPERIALVGVGSGAAAALVAAAEAATAVRRLVLITPTGAPEADLIRVPPTFLQSSPQSPALAVSRSLEIDLREAGVAVRPVEYAGLPDAWARYPRFAPGSKRAVEDIVAFLRRGFGMDGTFSGVIPGWELS